MTTTLPWGSPDHIQFLMTKLSCDHSTALRYIRALEEGFTHERAMWYLGISA